MVARIAWVSLHRWGKPLCREEAQKAQKKGINYGRYYETRINAETQRGRAATKMAEQRALG
jgi:hypothetical protein